MHDSNNSALSKNISFETTNHININFILNNVAALKKISTATVKEDLMNHLLTPREVIQVLYNLEALQEATRIFKERNATKLPSNITEVPRFPVAKTESIELSQYAKEVFAKIGLRARKAFIEEQI